MKKHILKLLQESAGLRLKNEQLLLKIAEQKAIIEKELKQLEIEEAIKKAKNGIPDR